MFIEKLKLNENNPRTISEEKLEKLKKSILEFPKMLELRPIIINEDYVVIAGNMRLTALIQLGYKEIPDEWVKVGTLKDEEQKRFIIADNVGYGEWNWEDLSSNWNSDELLEWGLDLPETSIIGDVILAEEDDYEVPDGGIETDIVIGDLFEIGEHRLLCGDSTQTDTYEKLMQGELADMVVTDPPYNVNYEGKTKDALKIDNDSMSNDDFYKFLYDFYTALTTAVKKGGAIYVWHASSEIINFGKAMVDSGWLLKQQLIWVKNSMVMGRQDYQWKHEPCLYGWLKGDSHKWYSDRKQTTVINFDRPNRNAEHPTMKPVGLFGYQIGNSSKVGDIVIDAFGGSGTTMVACQILKRKARLIEFDPRYCQAIIDRMRKLDSTIIIKRNGLNYERKKEIAD